MKRSLFLSILCLWGGLLSAQPFQLAFEKEFTPNFFDYFLSSGQKDFYLSPDGKRLIMSTDLRYQVFDAADGSLLGEGKHVSKVNAGVASLLGILKNRSFNREDAIEKTRFEEGTEYMVFPEEDVIVFLDWNVDESLIKAVNLSDGQLRWQVDRYRYTASSKAQFVDEFLNVANVGRLNRSTSSDIAVATARLQGFGEGAFTAAPASMAAYGFLTPMPGTGLCLMRIFDEYVALDLKTGEEKWRYDDRALTFGFAKMAEDGNLIVVNYTGSYFKENQRLILKLDAQTGEEIWAAEHLSDFRAGRTYLLSDRLVCDYYGAEVFDLKTGERMLLSLDEKIIKRQNTMTSMFNSSADGSRGTEAIASPSVVEGRALYTSCFKLGKKAYANDGSSKAIVQKWDLGTGEMQWESDKLDRGTDLSYASADHVFVRKGKAMGKSSLFVLDANTGKELTETETIEGFIHREGAADVLTAQYLYRGGKKNIYAFDQQSWKVAHEFSLKGLSVGKLQAMFPGPSQLMVVGDKGLVWYDAAEGGESALTTDPILATFWNDRYCYLFTENNTQAVDLQSGSPTGELASDVGEGTIFLFSEDGQRMAVVEGERYLRVYENR